MLLMAVARACCKASLLIGCLVTVPACSELDTVGRVLGWTGEAEGVEG